MSFSEGLLQIKALEGEIMRKAAERFKADKNLSHADFFVIGAINRTIVQSKGFCLLIDARNFACAAAILRMQIDTAMRINALVLLENPNESCSLVLSGQSFNKFKDKHGNKLSDFHLKAELCKLYPWVDQIYRNTSDFVHLSGRHFYTSIAKMNDETRTIHLEIGGESDVKRPDKDYFEIIGAFFQSTELVQSILSAYLESRVS